MTDPCWRKADLMTATITDPDGFDRLRLAALSSLTADKVTPEHVLSWDPSGQDRTIRAFASDLAAFQGVPSPALALSAPGPTS